MGKRERERVRVRDWRVCAVGIAAASECVYIYGREREKRIFFEFSGCCKRIG